MPRLRWLIPLVALGVALAPALASTSASASTHLSGALAIQPGGHAVHMIKPGTGTALGVQSGPRNESSSTNWSGYAAVGGTYTSVSASWVQPTVTCTSTSSYASFWVGLDGYSNGSVEQDGTAEECLNGTPYYYGWYETYPNPANDFGETVKAGDTITASVVYQGSNQFQLNLADKTQGWTDTTTQTVPGAARSSAEVIIEAPSESGGGVLPLADFGTVRMANSLVDGSPIGSHSPVQIYMANSAGTTLDTVSSLSADEDFSATWVSPVPVPVLSHGKAVATSPTREKVTWQQTIPSWEQFRIAGPGAINGHVGWVPPGTTSAYYSGLEAHHGYTVTYTPYTGKNGSPIAGAKPGAVYFVS